MKCSLVPLIFLRRSLVFPILLFSSISLHWLLRKAFLSLLANFWNISLEIFISSLLFSHQVISDPLTAACQAFLSFTTSWSLLKVMSIELVMPSNHFILCRSLLLLPSVFPSIMVFSSELVLHIRWSKYWSFSFSISPSNEYLGFISFRINWFDLFAVQGTA